MQEAKENELDVSKALLDIVPLLSRQGPIKDFIHLNLLQDFLHLNFDEAKLYASKIFGAKAYMDLSYYRQKYFLEEIEHSILLNSISQNLNLDKKKCDIVLYFLLNYVDIFDEKTFFSLVKKENLSFEKAEKIITFLDFFEENHEDFSIHQYINENIFPNMKQEVNSVLFRLLGSYLDQGVCLWNYLDSKKGFLDAIIFLLKNNFFPIAYFADNHELLEIISEDQDKGIKNLLSKIVSRKLHFDYLKETLLEHRGWSGIINVLEHNLHLLAKPKLITLKEVLLFKLSLEWLYIKNNNKNFSLIKAQDLYDKRDKQKNNFLRKEQLSLTYLLLKTDLVVDKDILKKINLAALQKIWHDALEQSYYQSVFKKFSPRKIESQENIANGKYQAVFCIDDRECSFRRNLEEESLDIQTFSFPGFFGIDCFFKAHKKDLLDKICPVPLTPKHVIFEEKVNDKIHQEHKLVEFASFISRHGANSIWFGFISAYTLGHLSLFRLLLSFFHPFKFMQTKKKLYHTEKTKLIFEQGIKTEYFNGLRVGYTDEEMAERVFNVLSSIGLINNFSSLIFIVSHSSSSVNNPHFASYECGACSGKPGVINSRVFCLMANKSEVRKLIEKKGIAIPDETFFVSGNHNTTTDEIDFFDYENLSARHLELLEEFRIIAHRASKKNAIERCKIFSLVPINISGEQALEEVKHRSKSLFEPRPELGHINNALCIIARRKRTFGENFVRRAFLQSYDPKSDCNGDILADILASVIPVCGGINLDYYFSRLDPSVYGCGSKLSHNVCALLGVGNGVDDDLLTGLPIQMTELHDPIRLLLIIEQTEEIIVKAIKKNILFINWIKNDWIKIAQLDPDSNNIVFFQKDKI